MTDTVSLSEQQYRLLDTVSKLLGLGLVAVGLEVGGSTPTGFALAVAGALSATLTVFLTHE